MSANLEIKARCADLAALRERARSVATGYLGVDQQVDTYFCTRRGRFKLRESSLSGGQLIPYARPDRDGPKRSDYRVIPLPDPAGTRDLLGVLLGVHRVVRKRREIFLYENVRIHLDEVETLGSFMELEAVFDGTPEEEADQRERVRFLMEALEVGEDELVATSYEGLLADAPEDAA